MLKLTREHLEAIRVHAENTYPDECCGLLLGKSSQDSKTIVQVIATENVWNVEIAASFQELKANLSTTRRSNFAIAPEVILKSQRQARDRHLDIIGIYHSHPDHPALPSEFDLAIAWQQYSYIIVSVPNGKASELLSWTLDDQHQFQPEKIVTIEIKQIQNLI